MTFAMGVANPQYKAMLGSPPTDPNTTHTQFTKKINFDKKKKKHGGWCASGERVSSPLLSGIRGGTGQRKAQAY